MANKAQATERVKELRASLPKRVVAMLDRAAQPAGSEVVRTGNAAVDGLLEGGLPAGSVCEVTGLAGSGRTTLALSVLAGATQGGACGYVDLRGNLSPHSAAAAGVELRNLLWICCAGGRREGVAGPARRAVARPAVAEAAAGMCRPSGHPRYESKGVAPAMERLAAYGKERRERKLEGTPGYRNQPLGLGQASAEQIAWERFNLRQVDAADPQRVSNLRAAAEARRRAATVWAGGMERRMEDVGGKPWAAMDRAIRATDYLLQARAFRVVVLDLAQLLPEQALRIPLATWWRFRRAAEAARTLLLVLAEESCARASAACVLQCSSTGFGTTGTVLTASRYRTGVTQCRSVRHGAKKMPGRETAWDAVPTWMRTGL